MKLKEWREEQKLSQAGVAALMCAGKRKGGKTGIIQVNIWHWENGVMPRKNMLALIAKVTKGKVTPNDFI